MVWRRSFGRAAIRRAFVARMGLFRASKAEICPLDELV
jgi:hypothetical protein